jgi:hypothetical protein
MGFETVSRVTTTCFEFPFPGLFLKALSRRRFSRTAKKSWSVLARQMDDVVGEVQRDFIQRKIRVLDLLGEYDIVVAIVAR